MSSEHRLSAPGPGLYGKHPAFGDFISAGLPGEDWRALADWMEATFGVWRETAGPGWAGIFDAAPNIRFWLGAELTGREALRGVWSASQDRVGRRFPLLLAQGSDLPPVSEPDQQFYEQAETLLGDLRQRPGFDPAGVVEELGRALPPGHAAHPVHPSGFWAANPGQGAAALWSDMAPTDHLHAATARSYWWVSAGHDGPSAGVAVSGWPDANLLGWLLSGGQPLVAQDPERMTAP